jgi:type IX secretion system PorP/SprF family membrane protein
MKKLLTILCLMLIVLIGRSQYIPQFSQLIKTIEFVNPGYNASKTDPSVTLLYRNQWTGFPGAPKTYATNLNIPVNKWHTGFGMNVIAETRGLITQTDAALNACVDVKANSSTYLAFGLSMGAEIKQIDMTRAIYLGETFSAEDYNHTNFYTGVGLNLFAKDLHLGASFHYTPLNGNYYQGNESYSLYLNGSYLFDLSEDWSIKPSVIYRHFAKDNDLDLGIFVLYKDLVWIGVADRINSALIFFADVKINKYLRFGYSFDLGTTGISGFNYGSHEVSLQFMLPRNAKQFERLVN